MPSNAYVLKPVIDIFPVPPTTNAPVVAEAVVLELNPDTVDQLNADPLVVKYFPLLSV